MICLRTILCVVLTLLSVNNYCDTGVYYITPSASEPCPADFCLSLSQFASNTSNYLHFNTTLIFQSGNHILDSTIKINGLRSLQLQKSTLVPSATVQCEHFASFSFFNITSVYIKELKFVNCSNNLAELVQHFSIEDVHFVGQENSSSTLEVVITTAVIRQSSFSSCRNGKLKKLVKWKPRTNINAEVSFSGGAMVVTQSDITIVGSTFKDNSAEVGGAIFFKLSRIRIENSTFVENYVTNQRNDSSCRGGALYFQTGYMVTIHNCSFTNNTGLWKGSGVHVNPSGGGAITFVGEHFVSFPIFPIGYHPVEMVVNMSLCDFSGNKAERGGAIVATDVTILQIYQSNFTSNKDGAIISIMTGIGCILNIYYCRFSNNEGMMFGGAVLAELMEEDHSMSIYGNNFFANVAGKYGGAVSINASGPKISVNIEECNFSSNMAGNDGGAIIVIGYPWMNRVTFKNSQFFGNTAQHRGGAIFTTAIAESVENIITLSLFKNNYASRGGAMFAEITTIFMTNSNFTANRAEIGVIHCVQSTIVIHDNVQYSFNLGSIFLFGSTLTFKERSYFWGENNSSPTKNKSIISFQEGGVITTFQSNVSLYGNCTLLYNKAESGGALHAIESKIYVYHHLHTMNNSATESGGGIYLYLSELVCGHNCLLTILFNKACKKGGGIYASNSVIKMHFTVYKGSLGGFIYKVSYVAFVRNSAWMGGGMCFEVNSKVYILTHNLVKSNNKGTSIAFISNSAFYGGAVYVADDTNYSTCTSSSYMFYSTITECSIQVLALPGRHKYDSEALRHAILYFKGNNAVHSGSIIFGGLLDRCTISPFDVVYSNNKEQAIDGFTHIKLISTITNSSTIASHAVKIYFCWENQPQ